MLQNCLEKIIGVVAQVSLCGIALGTGVGGVALAEPVVFLVVSFTGLLRQLNNADQGECSRVLKDVRDRLERQLVRDYRRDGGDIDRLQDSLRVIDDAFAQLRISSDEVIEDWVFDPDLITRGIVKKLGEIEPRIESDHVLRQIAEKIVKTTADAIANEPFFVDRIKAQLARVYLARLALLPEMRDGIAVLVKLAPELMKVVEDIQDSIGTRVIPMLEDIQKRQKEQIWPDFDDQVEAALRLLEGPHASEPYERVGDGQIRIDDAALETYRKLKDAGEVVGKIIPAWRSFNGLHDARWRDAGIRMLHAWLTAATNSSDFEEIGRCEVDICIEEIPGAGGFASALKRFGSKTIDALDHRAPADLEVAHAMARRLTECAKGVEQGRDAYLAVAEAMMIATERAVRVVLSRPAIAKPANALQALALNGLARVYAERQGWDEEAAEAYSNRVLRVAERFEADPLFDDAPNQPLEMPERWERYAALFLHRRGSTWLEPDSLILRILCLALRERLRIADTDLFPDDFVSMLNGSGVNAALLSAIYGQGWLTAKGAAPVPPSPPRQAPIHIPVPPKSQAQVTSLPADPLVDVRAGAAASIAARKAAEPMRAEMEKEAAMLGVRRATLAAMSTAAEESHSGNVVPWKAVQESYEFWLTFDEKKLRSIEAAFGFMYRPARKEPGPDRPSLPEMRTDEMRTLYDLLEATARQRRLDESTSDKERMGLMMGVDINKI